MTQQYGIGAATNIAQGLQGLRSQALNQQAVQQQIAMNQEKQALAAQQREAEAAQQRQWAEAVQRLQSGDPNAMTDMILMNPEVAGQVREQIGAEDEARATQLQNTALGFKQAVQAGPESALQYYQQNMAGDPLFAEIQDEVAAGDFNRALSEMRAGVAAIGGREGLDAFDKASGPKIGTYNPRDYTVESFALFNQTGDESVLERYEPSKVVEIGGVPHVFSPASQQWEPVSVSRGGMDEEVTTETVAESEAAIAGAKSRATGEAAQEIKEASPEAQERRRLQEQEATRAMDIVDRLLDSDNLGRISGAETSVPVVGSIQAATARDELNDLKALANLLTMGNLGRMTGVLSESDIRLIASAASGMEIGDSGTPITEAALRRNLRDIKQRLRDGVEQRSSPPEPGRQEPMGSDSRGVNAPSQQNRMTEQTADDFINSVLGGQ